MLPENARIWLGLDPTLNATTLSALSMDEGFKESNQMHAINGYVYGNLNGDRGLAMTEGEVVRWHVMGLGNQEDIHTPHWHGQALLLGSGAVAQRVDVVNILPATQLTLQARMENVGTWLYHCHVNHHIHAGIAALYTVAPCPTNPTATSCSSAVELKGSSSSTPAQVAAELDRLARRDEALTATLIAYGLVALMAVVAACASYVLARPRPRVGGAAKVASARSVGP